MLSYPTECQEQIEATSAGGAALSSTRPWVDAGQRTSVRDPSWSACAIFDCCCRKRFFQCLAEQRRPAHPSPGSKLRRPAERAIRRADCKSTSERHSGTRQSSVCACAALSAALVDSAVPGRGYRPHCQHARRASQITRCDAVPHRIASRMSFELSTAS